LNKKKINVLFAPANTASMPDITLQALNRLGSINAKGVSLGNHYYWTFGPNWTIIEIPSFRKNPIGRVIASLKKIIYLSKAIIWADLLMWHWDIDTLSKWLVKLFRKKIYVEWIGSDIRNPELLFLINPYYKKAWEDGEWTYTNESQQKSDAIQARFKFINAQVAVCPEISLFLNKKYFTNNITLMQRIDIRNYKAKFPEVNKLKPTIVHTPSATGAKGTKYVIEAISNLEKKGLLFSYVEIHNKARQEALTAILSADIFIDQFIAGSYGLATCEAMAMGKPVFCYLMPPVAEKLPKDCPIVNTSIDTLEATLEVYITNPQLRYDTGVLSRAFAEKYHDADKIALQLEQLFKDKLTKN
jgi:glycosyltransferase involved in cell wall biosynthesis